MSSWCEFFTFQSYWCVAVVAPQQVLKDIVHGSPPRAQLLVFHVLRWSRHGYNFITTINNPQLTLLTGLSTTPQWFVTDKTITPMYIHEITQPNRMLDTARPLEQAGNSCSGGQRSFFGVNE